MADEKNVCIVVVGDIGRSPRMQYHALSLAEHNYTVDIIGYGETQPLQQLQEQSQVYFHYLTPYANLPLFRLLNYLLKTLWQSITLLWVLAIIRTPHTILVQNPPAVPGLFVCWLYSRIIGAKLIVDWHNYAHTIMALSVGCDHILVRITRQLEHFIGRRSDKNLCVTKAMKNDLDNLGIQATVLYDRPPNIFTPLDLEEKHQTLTKLGQVYPTLLNVTAIDQGNVILKPDRPALLISSTSWTEDEDFSLLLTALQEYENQHDRNLPKLTCIITGKGPQKDFYKAKINETNWKKVEIITPWLESGDYPRLLACADLGVSLHTSSSGLDLPMKVIDMFGCGLPVCALNFQCLNELVQHKVNSFVFNDSTELSRQIQSWFKDFPNNKKRAQIELGFKEKLESFQRIRWKENWDLNALPLF